MADSRSLRDLLPFLALGKRTDLLPLLLLLGEETSSSSSTSNDDEGDGGSSPPTPPTTFLAYATSLVGDLVRVSVAHPVDNATLLIGTLREVGTDFLLLRDVSAGGVNAGFFRQRVAVPISNVVSIERLPFFEAILPYLVSHRHHSS